MRLYKSLLEMECWIKKHDNNLFSKTFTEKESLQKVELLSRAKILLTTLIQENLNAQIKGQFQFL